MNSGSGHIPERVFKRTVNLGRQCQCRVQCPVRENGWKRNGERGHRCRARRPSLLPYCRSDYQSDDIWSQIQTASEDKCLSTSRLRSLWAQHR